MQGKKRKIEKKEKKIDKAFIAQAHNQSPVASLSKFVSILKMQRYRTCRAAHRLGCNKHNTIQTIRLIFETLCIDSKEKKILVVNHLMYGSNYLWRKNVVFAANSYILIFRCTQKRVVKSKTTNLEKYYLPN